MAANNSTVMPDISRRCASNLYLCQDWYRAAMYEATIATAVVNGLLTLVASLGNGLVFAAYYYTESLRRPLFTILMAVAITDFLTGVISQPIFIYVLIKTLSSCPNYVCKVDTLGSVFMIFFLGLTIFNLSVITVDRYIAIFHSFKYEEIVTNSRVVKVLSIVWVLWIVMIVCIGMVGFKINIILGALLSLNIIFICFLYFKIFKEVQRLESTVVVPANQPQEVKKARERKSAITTGYIIGALLLCFVPMVIAILILPLFQDRQNINQTTAFRFVFLIATSCYLSNSSLNVIIYGWKNNEMKTAMLKVIRMIRQKFTNEVNPLN